MKHSINQNLVSNLLRLDQCCSHFTATVSPAEARAFACRANAYNNFTQESLARMIAEIDELIPGSELGRREGDPICKTHEYRIGNECSRVVYVHLVKVYVPDCDFAKLANGIAAAARRAEADEMHDQSNGYEFIYRIWFD